MTTHRISLVHLASILLLMAALLPMQGWSALQESANRECALCHVMWLTEFKRNDISPLIPYDPKPVVEFGRQDVVSTQRMCVSCHDGFVLDSRDMWKTGRHSHPVGQQPSEHITIPTSEGKEIFPLNDDGRVYCGTCHSAHGTDWQKGKQSIFMRMDNMNSRMCMACHFNLSTGIRDGNHPVNKVLASMPDNLVTAGSRFSDKNAVICQSCHRAHGGKGDPLLVIDNKESRLCASCHDSPAQVVTSKHNLSRSVKAAKNINDSTTAESGPCSACHIPHYARGPRLWARSVAPGPDFLSSACVSCHNERGIAKDKTVGTHSHPVGVPLSNIGIEAADNHWALKDGKVNGAGAMMQALPLFEIDGNRAKSGGNINCLTCHNPHQWRPGETDAEAAAEVSAPGSEDSELEEGDGSSSFLRIANDDDSQLCTNCHVSKAGVRNSKHNLNHTAPEATNKEGMDANQSGTCSACHLPHNGKGPGMWARLLPPDYSGVEQRCVSCHADNAMASEYQTGLHSHPLHRDLGDLQNTAGLPLYDASGHNSDGELIDCGTCHDPHNWSPGVNTVGFADTEGDGSNSFLRVRASGNSLLCQGCHRSQATIEGTDHDLSVTAPDTANSKQQTVSQTGLCAQCHAIHNATLPIRLGIAAATGEVPSIQLCTRCHSETGAASAKVPEQLTHPDRAAPVNDSRLRDGALNWDEHPVFDSKGKSAGLGQIICITCHNPHQWDPAKAAKGSGEKIEGSVLNSFLRVAATDHFLCSDCHGSDSLYRYKYFHWQKSRALERPRKPE